jgi:CheY-like chemotaxis protein
VTLEASRAGNTMVLSVHDDGRGLDHDAIAAKGRRLGLIAPGDVPSVDRLNALIFQPGFSTREEASAIAGRGVGMDVVSQEVGRLHGTITLNSVKGQGTRLSICLPARLALEQAMISRIDGRSFALPVDLIDQAQALDCEDVDRSGPHPRVRMREQWVPLIDAREALGISPGASVPCPKVLLVRADGEGVAVVVDSIEGTRELVIRPLGALLSGHPLVSGTSLSVNGEVVFALSPSGLARRYREMEETNKSGAVPPSRPSRSPRILVADDSISVRRVVARQFRSLGYKVEEVSDGLEALGRARHERYDLIFSDLEMPRMDGFELLAELGRLGVLATTPVVIATSRCDPETHGRAGELGAREFLHKPIDSDRLTAVVRALLPLPEPAPAEPEATADLNGSEAIV